MVHKALDCGITLFDTADIYGERGGSETCLGQILGDRRKDIVLATKFGMAMRGRKETLFIPYRTTNTIIEYEPDRRIAWKTTALGGLLAAFERADAVA